MGKPFLSRHFLGEDLSCIAAVPFAAAGAAEGGVATTHNLLALGTWSEDAQESRLTIVDLAVGHSGDEVAAHPAMKRLASFTHSGRVAAVEVADLGSGALLLLAASGDGIVGRLRMTVPTQPGSQPEEIQLREEDFDGALLLPWLDAHTAPVAALAASTDRRELLTAAADGSLALTPLTAEDSSSSSRLYDSSGAVTFSAARWNGPHTAVTGSLQGLLHVWDARQGGRPALQLQQPVPAGTAPGVAALPAAAITCLDVHPAQHFACATGAADGSIAVWDLRAASASQQPGQQAGAGAAAAPAVACCSVTGGTGASVCDLRFEGSSTIGSGSQRLVYCTSGGALGLLRDAAAGAGRLLFQEPTAAVRGCCMGATGPCTQLFATTDQEGLVYIANAF
ncbi:nuclear pore complex NUP43 [Chlorella sorokiniana]|uniref:Nuclear pore complex NUP43 n=1 Tax=Chlorella sorokiniana TaxID=3076 RepID=A0A2P6TKE2_CHLSO|nr:nuclear pore complex NUP43 [Chlorella sorokiniana]|eukprot:PRW44562.1 nuclear pore complex NUP43 [Chlorella sorokiniana]